MSLQGAVAAVFILYLIATLFYWLRLIFGHAVLGVIGLRVTLLAVVVQTVALACRFWQGRNPALSAYFDYFQLSALALAVVFIALCFAKRFYAAGPLFLVVITVLVSLSLSYHHANSHLGAGRGQGYLLLHLGALFFSLSAFSISLVSALLFLMEEGQIKAKHLAGWIAKLPPLAVLDDVHYKALVTGFVLFSLSILMGSGYAKLTTGHYLGNDSKQVLSVILWLFFALTLNLRVRHGLTGHKGVVLSLAGFAGLIFVYFVGLR